MIKQVHKAAVVLAGILALSGRGHAESGDARSVSESPEEYPGIASETVNSNGRNPPANSISPNPWTETDLNRVALSDRDGYDVMGWMPQSTYPSDRTAVPADCSPIVQTLGQSSSAYPANARVHRMFSPEGAGSGAVMTLASHRVDDAKRAVRAFRVAAEKCTAFKDVEQSFDYGDGEVQPDPEYGDESVALRLVQIFAYPDGESLRVPHAVVVVRKGTTVAMFHESNTSKGPDGKKSATIPDDLIRAQLSKIAKFGTAE
ncbi:hypothetical protein ABT063_17065 [Streptomyces sp. NPDC002838]|uniref:hypothetical protein n=1 Tax=Streptomyces sp. NPDC002838 TaxID=3154436 RepID=UPI00332AA1E4